MRSLKVVLAGTVLTMTSAARAEDVRLYAAGSLKAAMSDIARKFEARSGGAVKVELQLGASGLLRDRIAKGEPAHAFASANMEHPESLVAAGKAAGPVRMFARNEMCGVAQGSLDVAPDTLLDRLLDARVRVGMSTPKADPAGDYALALFAKADALAPGARARLEEKALRLTGGAETQKAPEGRNQYGWVMSEGKADLFLTYCTNAVLARKDTGTLRIVAVPGPLAVSASYGLVVLKEAPPAARQLADFILGPEGQAVLAGYGFGRGADARAEHAK